MEPVLTIPLPSQPPELIDDVEVVVRFFDELAAAQDVDWTDCT